MTAEQWKARAEAWNECAEHLGQRWTDDPDEKEQGGIVAKELRAKSATCLRIASDPALLRTIDGTDL